MIADWHPLITTEDGFACSHVLKRLEMCNCVYDLLMGYNSKAWNYRCRCHICYYKRAFIKTVMLWKLCTRATHCLHQELNTQWTKKKQILKVYIFFRIVKYSRYCRPLLTREELKRDIEQNILISDGRITSHPSPMYATREHGPANDTRTPPRPSVTVLKLPSLSY